MNDAKSKATDYLVESLKLVVALSTVLLGGLLAFRAKIIAPRFIWSFYFSLSTLVLSIIFSALNVNSLIKKVFRGNEDAIKHKEVKYTYILAAIFLVVGIIFGAIFLSSQTVTNNVSVQDNQTIITDTEIVVSGEVSSNIQITRDSNGKITNVTISPK